MTTVAEALALLQRSKAAAASSLRQAKAAALAQLSQAQHRLSPRHTPSGPRRRNEGIEDEDQGIVAAEASANGATVTVSLLAAGFVVGPGGASVRAICAATGADVRSYTESQDGRRVRVFVIEGKPKHAAHALQLIAAAVERYVELTGGAFCNMQVEREQVIGGVSFMYQPPPRAAVPYAAALKAVQDGSGVRISPSVPAKPASLFSPRTSGKENGSSGGTYQPLTSLATPTAPTRNRPSLPALAAPLPLPAFAPLSRTSSGPVGMDEDEVAATPAYTTTPVASYSLFSGSGLGAGAALFGQAEPFGSGGSVFSSAFETPSVPSATGGCSLFSTPSAPFGVLAADATPDIAISSGHLVRGGSGAFDARLLRAASFGEDALMAAAPGFPAFPATFPSQGAAAAFPASAPALPPQPQPQQLQQSTLMSAGPLGLLPLGAAFGAATPSPWASTSGTSIW